MYEVEAPDDQSHGSVLFVENRKPPVISNNEYNSIVDIPLSPEQLKSDQQPYHHEEPIVNI